MKSTRKRISTTNGKAASAATGGGEVEIQDESLLEYLAGHAPIGWERDKQRYVRLLREYLNHEKPLRMIVLSADIRKSTFLMQESVSFRKFAQLMGRFIDQTAQLIQSSDGWFDKFTGDGFLAYWLRPEEDPDYSEFLKVCQTLLYTFKESGMDIFRKNCRNFPSGVGLSLGVDAGDAFMVTMAGDLTIVGPPVVGAVRMVDAAVRPWETVCNVFLGDTLFENRATLLSSFQIEVLREYRKTKEYEEQEVYPIVFHTQPVAKISNGTVPITEKPVRHID